MKDRIFVSGSIAYDYIMQYMGEFKNALLKDHLDDLNVSFSAHNKRRHFGGCGGNIAYSLALLKENVDLYGIAGKEFEEYKKWFIDNGINLDLIGLDKDKFTATCYILTDQAQKQITTFCPEAMESDDAAIELTDEYLQTVKFALLSPDICRRTAKLGGIFKEAGVPYFFDPGQMTAEYTVKELKELLENAYGFIANSYEVKLTCEILHISREELASQVEMFIETMGERGSSIIIKNQNGERKEIHISRAIPTQAIDPTGCGDAFRSGVLSGLRQGFSPEKACKMGAVVAAYSIETEATQLHKFTLDEFWARYEENFGNAANDNFGISEGGD
ncbi:carbohydrate kinase family protein [Patescibacteria group bacterium]|nr:carbohydrate kinase family protein [Patescibacteria group bacterium]